VLDIVASAKKKIQAADVVVGNRTLEGVLIDLAEQVKANDARFAERITQFEARSADAAKVSADAARRSADAAERSARAEELATIALQTIAAVSKDLRALAQRTDERLGVLEKASAAE
jgi:hypothetical protein